MVCLSVVEKMWQALMTDMGKKEREKERQGEMEGEKFRYKMIGSEREGATWKHWVECGLSGSVLK